MNNKEFNKLNQTEKQTQCLKELKAINNAVIKTMAAKYLGSIKSEAKAKASRENGKKGGYHKNFKKK